MEMRIPSGAGKTQVVEAVIDIWIKSLSKLHDVLHRFCAGRGTGTAIIELKLSYELSSVDQDSLFLLLLYLRKSYDNLDRGVLLQIIEGYGEEPKLRGLLVEFWTIQEVITRQNGFRGPQFQATRRTIQRGLALPTLFNVEVDRLVHH